MSEESDKNKSVQEKVPEQILTVFTFLKDLHQELFEGKKLHDYLKFLSIGNYVLAAFYLWGALSALSLVLKIFPLIANSDPSLSKMIWPTVFAVITGIFMLASTAVIVLNGYFISKREKLKYCRIVSCLELLDMPLGTLIALASVIALFSPQVIRLFDENCDPSEKYYVPEDDYDRG